ncbi:hypothetical protein GGH96_005826 [Coemansia sp. RSA 1972]|nr:hypothetical protein GGH96_005826 [Coemansia sp. RSA 1972]
MYERDREIFCRTCFRRGPGAVPPAVNSTAHSETQYEQYSESQSQSQSYNQSYNQSHSQSQSYSQSHSHNSEAPPRPLRTFATPSVVPHTPPRERTPVNDYSPSSVFSSGRRSLNLPASKDMCPRCAKPIFHAEKVVGPGGPWHRTCFKCKQCSTTLDSAKLTEHDGEAFCRGCYTKLFSPRGYNIGGSTEPDVRSPDVRSIDMRGPSLASYGRSSPSPVSWSDDASSPFGSAVGAAASAAVQAHGRSIASHSVSTTHSTARAESRSRLSYGRPHTPVTFGLAPPDMCPRCNTRIYAAEQGMAAGRKYHKRCIKCKACHASINSLQLTERDGEIFCKQCYAKNFGPQGFRPSMSAPTNHH